MNSLIRDLAKKGIDVAQDGYVKIARLLGYIDFPVPPNSNMRRTSSLGIRHYAHSSVQTSLPIVTALRMLGYTFPPNNQILDFGAGVGRQLLYFSRHFPQLKIFACDVEASHIEWIGKNYPAVEAYTNAYDPPLKYRDGQFDLVYSISIFSHLPQAESIAYLNEFSRIIKPGGYACLTTLGLTAAKGLSDKLRTNGYVHWDEEGIEEAQARLKKRKFFKSTDMVGGLKVGYGVTYMTPDYIRDHWAGHGFDIAAIVEGVIDDIQDLVVLRRVSP